MIRPDAAAVPPTIRPPPSQHMHRSELTAVSWVRQRALDSSLLLSIGSQVWCDGIQRQNGNGRGADGPHDATAPHQCDGVGYQGRPLPVAGLPTVHESDSSQKSSYHLNALDIPSLAL